MRVRIWGLAMVMFLAAAGPLFGAGPDFKDLDRNGDGVVVKGEIDEAAPAVLKSHDANGDGTLDVTEFKAVGGDPSLFGDVDRDGNGRIDVDEFREAARKRFDQVDRNRDGRIDAQEWGRRTKPIDNPLIILYF